MAKAVASFLAVLLATAGLPPCLAMTMDMAVAPAVAHCDDMAPDPAKAPVPSGPDDCCVIGGLPDQRTPAERLASTTADISPLALASVPVLSAPPAAPAASRNDSGPPPPSVPRHLLLTVLLI